MVCTWPPLTSLCTPTNMSLSGVPFFWPHWTPFVSWLCPDLFIAGHSDLFSFYWELSCLSCPLTQVKCHSHHEDWCFRLQGAAQYASDTICVPIKVSSVLWLGGYLQHHQALLLHTCSFLLKYLLQFIIRYLFVSFFFFFYHLFLPLDCRLFEVRNHVHSLLLSPKENTHSRSSIIYLMNDWHLIGHVISSHSSF